MEQEPVNSEHSQSKFEKLHKLTPLSKYLAIALFVALLFISGWVGYTHGLSISKETKRTSAEDLPQLPLLSLVDGKIRAQVVYDNDYGSPESDEEILEKLQAENERGYFRFLYDTPYSPEPSNYLIKGDEFFMTIFTMTSLAQHS